MNEYLIRIGNRGDPPLFPEYAEIGGVGRVVGVGIIEGGMKSGKPSVGLIVLLDGTPMVVELGAEAFLTIGGVIKGAMARWGIPWEGA